VAPYFEAEFLLARSALRYLLGQFNDADAELVACRRFLTSVGKHPASGVRLRSLPQIEFASHCMAARTELARGRYQMAFAAIASAEGLSNVAKLPGHSAALALLRIDALLQRNDAEDCVAAQAAVLSLDHTSKIPAMLRWSDCAELARARIAVRVGMPDGSAQLRQVLDLLEDGAQEALLDVDVSFARLADAAEEAGDAMVARRARERAKWYRSRRIAAAGAAWGAR
jgi:hypothetical protein